MAELENEKNEETKTPEEVLKDLKKNTVPKEQFEELQKRYNKLYSDTANGLFAENEEEESKPDEAELKKQFEETIRQMNAHEVRGSYQQMRNLLAIDDYRRAHGERSAFAPSRGELSTADENACDSMHDILKYCVDNCGGSDEVASAMFANSLSYGK